MAVTNNYDDLTWFIPSVYIYLFGIFGILHKPCLFNAHCVGYVLLLAVPEMVMM